MACHSIVILGWQGCPPAIWLRALSRMALINAIAPIPYSSPMLLIKSPKIYNTGRLLHGCDHKFVRMRRIRAIPHVKVGCRVVSSPLRPDITHQPRTRDTDPISTPLSKFQRPHTYWEARGPRDLRKVYVCGQNRYQWVQLRGKSSTPTSRNIGCINQYQRIVYAFPQ